MRYLMLIFLLASCTAPSVRYDAVEMNSSITDDSTAESMIVPYRDSVQNAMKTVLIQNSDVLVRSIPESALGDMVSDLVLQRAKIELTGSDQPDFCLLNIGGLRIDLPTGDITVGTIFELMPFENEIDVVRLSPSSIRKMMDYLREKGGQPVAGIQLRFGPDAYSCLINGQPLDSTRAYAVATSDYLADGGDNMAFFKDPLSRTSTGVKIRDAIIGHLRKIGRSGSPLSVHTDRRLVIE